MIGSSTAEQALQKDEDVLQPLPSGSTMPLSAVFRPPPQSYSGMWQLIGANSSDVLFYVTAPGGSILLLDVEATGPTTSEALPSPGAVVSLTTGTYYRYSLDLSGSNVIKAMVASAF